MDIASLLAEADAEVAYDKDDFESFNHTAESVPLHGFEDEKDDYGGKPVSATSILQSAARIVEKEEVEEMKTMIKESVQEAAHEVEKIRDEEEQLRTQRTRTYSSDHDQDAAAQMNILVEAGKEVAGYHGQDVGHAVEESSEEEEEEEAEPEDDEDDQDEDHDPIVNRDLIHACHKGDGRAVQSLLKREGLNLRHVDRHGWTAMHWAASKGHTEIMDMLMDHRRIKQQKPLSTILNVQDKLAGWTPLHVSFCLLLSFMIKVVFLI